MRYRVFHMGIPLGWAELPDGRLWAGGMLDADSTYDALRPTLIELTQLAGRENIATLLKLPAGERPRPLGHSPSAAAALDRAADMDFELRTAAGARVGADVVRLIDLGDGSPARVAAQFRVATADAASWLPEREREGHDDHGAGV